MEIRQKLSLDFGRDTHPITVFAKQNDKNTRFLEIAPLNCGQAYAIEDGVTPRLQLTKADGHTVLNDATVENGVIVVELTPQALAAAGVAVAEIGLYKGEALLSSQIFYIDVERAAFDKDAPASSDEFNALVDALGKVDGSVAAAGNAAGRSQYRRRQCGQGYHDSGYRDQSGKRRSYSGKRCRTKGGQCQY